MSDIESRLNYLEDSAALETAFVAYLTAVDSGADMEGLLACFTEDAVLDFSGLDNQRFEGHTNIRKFFSEGFAAHTHLAHFGSNFRVVRLKGAEADCSANVMATWCGRSGREGLVYVRYDIAYVRQRKCWKFKTLAEKALMPVIPRSTASCRCDESERMYPAKD